MYRIRSNRNTVHIEGLPERTRVTGAGDDNGSGAIAYYAQSACPALTRSGARMSVGDAFEDATEAHAAAVLYAAVHNLKVCKRCEGAAHRLAAETAAADAAAVAAADLDEAAEATVRQCTACGTVNVNTQPCLNGDMFHATTRKYTRVEYEQHRAERRGATAIERELADSAPARAAYGAARTALTEGRTLRACDGYEVRPHIVTPAYTVAERLVDTGDARFCVFVEGMAAVYEATLTGALALVPEALADVAASCAPGEYAPTECVTADVHECWSRALFEDDAPALLPLPEDPAPALAESLAAIDEATAALTPERAAFYNRMGPALIGDPEPDTERPRMTKFQVVINQVVTTTVFVEAPDREAAVDLAVNELPELCLQCAGGGPRENAAVTDVNSYVNDHYDEPKVTELDENGCFIPTPEDTAAADAAFARVITGVSIDRDGSAAEKTHAAYDLAELRDELDQFHAPPAPVLFDLDPQGKAVVIDAPDEAARRLLDAATSTLPEPDEADEVLARSRREGEAARRACDTAMFAYWYTMNRYARSGVASHSERADEALDVFRAAAAAATRCDAIGIDWACDRTRLDGRTRCADHAARTDAREEDHRG